MIRSRLVRKCPPDLYLKLTMEVSRIFFEITRENIMVYNNQSKVFEKFLHDGKYWCVLIQKKRVSCSVFICVCPRMRDRLKHSKINIGH